jgi:CRP-like cAMP-binding protein
VQLRDDARSAILAAGDRSRYRRGASIFDAGDPAGPAMLIVSGTVDIVETVDGSRPLAQLGPGELFGEMAAIDGLPRSAGAVARDDVEVSSIDPIRFHMVLTDANGLVVDLIRGLTGRMRRALDDRLGRAARGQPPSRW